MATELFKIILLEEARQFLHSLPEAAKEKVYYNIGKTRLDLGSAEIFKKLENSDIWEFRTKYNGLNYRLFAFWDTEAETLIVATHGLVKKTQKNAIKRNSES